MNMGLYENIEYEEFEEGAEESYILAELDYEQAVLDICSVYEGTIY